MENQKGKNDRKYIRLSLQMDLPVKQYAIGDEIAGEELRKFLKTESDKRIAQMERDFELYHLEQVSVAWRDFMRHLEEFINIFYELTAQDKDLFEISPVRPLVPEAFEFSIPSHSIILRYFDEEAVNRLDRFVSLFPFSLLAKFRIITMGDLREFCSARRLHFLSISYLLGKHADGFMEIPPKNLLPNVLHYIESVLMPATSAFHAMVQSLCLPDFKAVLTPDGWKFNHDYSQLEGSFLEPQYTTEVDLLQYYKPLDKASLKRKSTKSLYSLEEYDINLYNELVYYRDFGILENMVYKESREFAEYMKRFLTDGYHIEIDEKELKTIQSLFPNLVLYKDLDSLFSIQSSRQAFYKVGHKYYSNYFLIIRYRVNLIQRLLRRSKSYQINAGYIFERKVEELLRKLGFVPQKGCKRIDHKEFDVVCLKDDIIYNFQCKNNFIDVTQIDTDKANVLARYHRRLAAYYDKALLKELDPTRESLLKERLGNPRIEHYVITRFPVITINPRVIPFNRIQLWHPLTSSSSTA